MKDCTCYPRLASMTVEEKEAMKAMRIATGQHSTWCPMYVDRSPTRPRRVGQLESLS